MSKDYISGQFDKIRDPDVTRYTVVVKQSVISKTDPYEHRPVGGSGRL